MARPKGNTKIYERDGVLMPGLEFQLPLKKNKLGFYSILPNKKFIGSKDSLRKLGQKKVKIGYIYLIRIYKTDKYKIGVTTNIKRRLSDISNYLPFELEILAINQINEPYKVEEELLNKYSYYSIKNEWFEFSIDQAKDIMIFLHNTQVKESIFG
jgi:hypothetical protein